MTRQEVINTAKTATCNHCCLLGWVRIYVPVFGSFVKLQYGDSNLSGDDWKNGYVGYVNYKETLLKDDDLVDGDEGEYLFMEEQFDAVKGNIAEFVPEVLKDLYEAAHPEQFNKSFPDIVVASGERLEAEDREYKEDENETDIVGTAGIGRTYDD